MLISAAFRIRTILTDNGKEFTDRFIANGAREPTGNHPFDQACAKFGIRHRLIKPKHPQTNGMVARFNGRISDILTTTYFDSGKSLKQTLMRYAKIYNHVISQKAIGHAPPIDVLKVWSKKRPDLFRKRVYKLAGPGR